MRYSLLFGLIVLTSHISLSQNSFSSDKEIRKGKWHIYWGWNWAWYGRSDINFNVGDSEFTIENTRAKDRQTDLSLTYINPARATIPQYNFRIGYYIKENWDISIGIDHMKYIVRQDQIARISGTIANTQTAFDGVYSNDPITIKEGFIEYEHTDGLNYINTSIRHTDRIFEFGKFVIDVKEGAGAGILVPKTRAIILNNDRFDEFHVSGYGVNGTVAATITFLNTYFVQTEFKGGYMDLPDVRITSDEGDSANQSFFFTQLNIAVSYTHLTLPTILLV